MHRALPGAGDGVAFVGHSQPTHSGNMLPFAQGLTNRGWTTHLGDFRGHGRSTGRGCALGHLEPGSGWEGMRDDLAAHLDATFDGVPWDKRLIVAPNISALLTLDLLHLRPDLARRIVLISPPPNQRAIHVLARSYVKARMMLHAPDRPDEKTLHTVYSFLGAQLKTRGGLTAAVTGDPKVAEALAADHLAWPVPTLGYWHEIFRGYEAAWTRLRQARIAPGTEILLLSGGNDPMVSNGRFIAPMLAELRAAGASSVSVDRVEGGRSGFFLEEARLNVAARVDAWARGEAGDSAPVDEGDMASVASDVLMTVGGRDGPIEADELVELCYTAIDDESRWVEMLYRLVHGLSGPEDEGNPDQLEKLLTALMPHWDRSYRLNRQIMQTAAIGSVMQNVLERFDLGLAVVDDAFEISYRNDSFARAATRLFGDVPLRDALPRAFRDQTREGRREAVLMIDGRPAGFYFRPRALRQTALQRGGASGVLALSSGQGLQADTRAERLDLVAFALGLTQKEAEVATLLADGLPTSDVAEALGISINTLRTHLKRIFEKLDVTSQVELVSLMRSSVLDWARAQPE
ncbi:Lysophospholipase, alpha-beta hydrolase superfamily [Jannaschia pohangensis]|uniref:Lysophospholipase, alpha-beta hydrolase superfamily n=2 Tax=Jannaschia pohangensis TaxID=390807 RepID=A0A1I3IIR1_9RHOB|nr:Lysophospholipase, alpha-beta hydrolase superfamily [Jannaschia pohangensis]